MELLAARLQSLSLTSSRNGAHIGQRAQLHAERPTGESSALPDDVIAVRFAADDEGRSVATIDLSQWARSATKPPLNRPRGAALKLKFGVLLAAHLNDEGRSVATIDLSQWARSAAQLASAANRPRGAAHKLKMLLTFSPSTDHSPDAHSSSSSNSSRWNASHFTLRAKRPRRRSRRMRSASPAAAAARSDTCTLQACKDHLGEVTISIQFACPELDSRRPFRTGSSIERTNYHLEDAYKLLKSEYLDAVSSVLEGNIELRGCSSSDAISVNGIYSLSKPMSLCQRRMSTAFSHEYVKVSKLRSRSNI